MNFLSVFVGENYQPRTVENLENEILNYPAPIHYGVAVNGKSGLIFPAKFISHAPDKDIRMLKSNVVLVYNSKEGKIKIIFNSKDLN